MNLLDRLCAAEDALRSLLRAADDAQVVADDAQKTAYAKQALADAASAQVDDAEAVCAALRRRGTAGISIQKLPHVVLTDVFLALPMKDLARAGRASKAWRDARWSDGLCKARGAAAAAAQRCELCCRDLPAWAEHLRVCCLKTCCNDCLDNYSDMKIPRYPPIRRDFPCPVCKMPAAKSDDELVARLQSHVDKGDAEARLLLGVWYEAGDHGIEKSTERAEELWELGASLGHSASAWQLACMWDERLESGHHHDQSSLSANALKYARMAADAGRPEAQADMAHFLIAGFRDNGQLPYNEDALHYLKNHDADSCTGEDGFLEAARYLRLVFEQKKLEKSYDPMLQHLKSLVDAYRERGIDVLTDPPTRNLPRS